VKAKKRVKKAAPKAPLSGAPLVRKWIEALRSGAYAQGLGSLYVTPEGCGERQYCCLGVLQQIAPASYHRRPGYRGYVTPALARACGLTAGRQAALAAMNDGEIHGRTWRGGVSRASGKRWSFQRIATFLEKKLLPELKKPPKKAA
jgi:hypothetical protein